LSASEGRFFRPSFTEYAQELAEDLGYDFNKAQWPATCIDWEQAVRELRMDYSCVEVNGVDYWFPGY